MTAGFRFDPPRVELSAELCWLLARAFGPVDRAVDRSRALDPGAAADGAEALDLAPRITSRTSSDSLASELGPEVVERFRRAHTEAAARALAAERICGELAAAAAELEIEVAVLKGVALQLSGASPVGSRDLCDVDVLAPANVASALHRHLVGAGCVSTDARTGEHQLTTVSHALGLDIEVHHLLRGVRLAGGARSAGFEALRSDGLLEPAEGFSASLLVPRPEVMLAHLLAHGIAQHGLLPGTYPMARVIADGQDLCPDAAGWEALLPAAADLAGGEVSAVEAASVRDLCLRLQSGEDPRSIAADPAPAGRLLRHIVAGATDRSYADAIRLRSRLHPAAADRHPLASLARSAWHTVWLNRTQVDVLYGRPRSPLGYWGWRLWRPFDLVGRAWRYGRAWLRHRAGR